MDTVDEFTRMLADSPCSCTFDGPYVCTACLARKKLRINTLENLEARERGWKLRKCDRAAPKS